MSSENQVVEDADFEEAEARVEGSRNDQLVPRTTTRSLESVLLEHGLLESRGISKIRRIQERKGVSFADAALKSGLVSKQSLRLAIARQFDYPCLLPGQGQFSKDVTIAYEPFGRTSEVFRSVRSYLLMHWLAPDSNCLVVVSPNRGEGRSYVAANLAVAFAQIRKRTLLIDANLRQPRLHRIFGSSGEFGLSSNILMGSTRIEPDAVPFLEPLYLLPAGPQVPMPQEIISSRQFGRLLRSAQKAFDVVVVDSPASDECADSELIAQQARNALLVCERDATSTSSLKTLAQRLRDANVRVIGSVVNGMPA